MSVAPRSTTGFRLVVIVSQAQTNYGFFCGHATISRPHDDNPVGMGGAQLLLQIQEKVALVSGFYHFEAADLDDIVVVIPGRMLGDGVQELPDFWPQGGDVSEWRNSFPGSRKLLLRRETVLIGQPEATEDVTENDLIFLAILAFLDARNG